VAALRERLAAQAGLLDSLSPLGVMRRGYGVVRRADGRLLRGVAGVRAGDAVEVRLADGALDADVRGVRPLPEE
jgi:exodeoxyribonuclease VII large subunit